jgi:MFS family permease
MRRTAMLVLLGAAAADFSIQQTISPALPRIQAEFAASPTSLAWTITAFLLSAAVALAVIGPLGDRIGRRRAFVGSLGLFAGGAAVCALANSVGILIAGRFIQGLGAGVAALALSIAKDQLPRDSMPRAVGILLGASGVGGVVGTLLTGVLADEVSIASVFWAQCALSALIAVGVWRVVPESPIYARDRLDWFAAGLLTTGVAALMLAISQTNAWGWSSARVLGLAALGAVLLCGWVARERTAATPLVGLPLMRRKTIWTANVAGFTLALVALVPFVLAPLLAGYPESTGYGLGLNSTEVALVLSPSSVAVLIAGVLGGRLVTVIGARTQALIAGASVVLAYVLFIVLPTSVAGLTCALIPIGIGMGLGFGALISLMLRGSSRSEAGVTAGLNSVVRTIGQALGPQIAIAIVVAAPALAPGVPSAEGFDNAFVVGLVAAVAALGATWIVPAAAQDPLTAQNAPGTEAADGLAVGGTR